jgi:hypothetical protein
MKECFVITTYCNTQEKIIALNRTIDNIKQYGLDIMLHAHYPLSDDIQKKVNHYYYSSNNPILHDRYNLFWHFVDNYRLEIKISDYYYTVLKAWSESINILSNNYDKIHIINYDTHIEPALFNLSRINDKSLFLQNSDLSKNYIITTYFCLNKKSFNFFRENITQQKYESFKSDSKFLPLVEEYIPSFTIGDDFYQIPHTDYNQCELLKYDIKADTRFEFNKTFTFKSNKVFIGEYDNSTQILFFDLKEKIRVQIENYSDIELDSNYLMDLKIPFNQINNLKIKINDELISEKFIERCSSLHCKIYQ